MESVHAEALKAVEAARKSGILEASDDAAVAALLHLAHQIDCLEGGMNQEGRLDNVSVPTFLKFAEALGLTPLSRLKIRDAKGDGVKAGGSVGSLAKFRALAGEKAG